MSESKFTPGPWETLDLGEAIIVQPTDKTLHPICLVDRQRNVFANAALIAAAPDMYESLKDAEKQIVQMYRGINPAANEGEGNRMADNDWSVKSIRAALAKAVKQ